MGKPSVVAPRPTVEDAVIALWKAEANRKLLEQILEEMGYPILDDILRDTLNDVVRLRDFRKI